MLLTALLLAGAVLAAPGEIHRCVGVDGRASFQDKPCTGSAARSAGQHFDDHAGSQRELREWLDRLRRDSAQHPVRTMSDPAIATPRSAAGDVTPAARGAVDQGKLAACSERFLACANGNDKQVDACVAGLARCSASRAGDCCPAECVTRYQDLRRNGAPLASAVRNALLDPQRTSCAAY